MNHEECLIFNDFLINPISVKLFREHQEKLLITVSSWNDE